jgi:hypothetical protein
MPLLSSRAPVEANPHDFTCDHGPFVFQNLEFVPDPNGLIPLKVWGRARKQEQFSKQRTEAFLSDLSADTVRRSPKPTDTTDQPAK